MSYNKLIPANNRGRILNYFIIEGIEGSGKSSCIQLLKEKFTKEKNRVKIIKEPGSSSVGELIRPLVSSPTLSVNQESLLFLMMGARADLYRELGELTYDEVFDSDDDFNGPHHPGFQEILLSDRGFPSTLALQVPSIASSFGIDWEALLERVWEMHEICIFPSAFPRAIFWLDAPPDVAHFRCSRRPNASAFDTSPLFMFEDWKQRYEKVFEFISSKGLPVVRIPASGPPDEVADALFQAIVPFFHPATYFTGRVEEWTDSPAEPGDFPD